MSVSLVLLQDWHPQSREAELQQWHTGMTWPLQKFQHHTSTELKDTAEGRVTNWFSHHFLCSEDMSAWLLDGQTEWSKVRERKREGGNMKDRELETSAPSHGLSQADKWFICFGFTSAALLTSTSLSFQLTTSDYQELFSYESHTNVLKTQDFLKTEHKKQQQTQEGFMRANTTGLLNIVI